MHHEGDLTVAEALIYAAICIFLTCLAGAMCRRRTWMRMCRNCRCSGTASGLTVGLLAIEPMNLKVIKATGTDDEKRSTPALFSLQERSCASMVSAMRCALGWKVRCEDRAYSRAAPPPPRDVVARQRRVHGGAANLPRQGCTRTNLKPSRPLYACLGMTKSGAACA